MVLVVKNLPANPGYVRDRVRFLGQEDLLKEGAWQSTPVFLPGESHEQRSLAATVHRVAQSRTRLK